MGEVMKEAAFSLAEAKFATGDFNQVVLQNVTKAQIKIRTKKDNVAGVTLPVFESYTVSSSLFCSRGILIMICPPIGRLRHLRVGRSGPRWSAAVQVEEELPGGREAVGGTGFAANVFRDPRRGHQSNQPKSERHRAR